MNIIKSLSLLVIGAAACVACDNIGENERYIELDRIEAKRSVLLEEFTGQRCTNCPEGHEVARSLREQYGDRLIPVSIHGGRLSIKGQMGTLQGLATDESDAYYVAAGSPDLPSGVVNRSTGCIDRSEWAEAVRRELEKETPATIDLTAELKDGDIIAKVNLLSDIDLSCTLQLWVVETDIVAYQYDHGANVMDYTHEHVFRSSINGTDGEKITLKKDIYADFTSSIALGEGWNPEKVSVIAILSNDSGVIQCAEAHLE